MRQEARILNGILDEASQSFARVHRRPVISVKTGLPTERYLDHFDGSFFDMADMGVEVADQTLKGYDDPKRAWTIPVGQSLRRAVRTGMEKMSLLGPSLADEQRRIYKDIQERRKVMSSLEIYLETL